MTPPASDSLATPRRACCARCTRPVAACICRWVVPTASAAGLLILQHPMEVANAKGSARLLHLSVAGSVMATGEVFAPAQLQALLTAQRRQPVLLYPDTPDERALGLPAPPPLPPQWRDDPAQVLLVVLDGTWRKSRKMLYQNAALQTLPRWPLTAMPPSLYRIRKAHAPDQLSTLEASCHALGQLDGAPERYQPLLERFDAFVEHFTRTGGRLDSRAQ